MAIISTATIPAPAPATTPPVTVDQAQLAHAKSNYDRVKALGDKSGMDAWNQRINAVNNGTYKPPVKNSTSVTNTNGANNDINSFLSSSTYKTPQTPSGNDADTRKQYAADAFASLSKNIAPDYDKRRQELNDQLVNSGNAVGSPQYNQQMSLLQRNQDDANLAAQNQAAMVGRNDLTADEQVRLGFDNANNNTLGTIAGVQGQYANQGIATTANKNNRYATDVNAKTSMAVQRLKNLNTSPDQSPYGYGPGPTTYNQGQ